MTATSSPKSTRTPSARNVLAVLRTASADQMAAGIDWYATAHDTACGMAHTFGVTVEQAAGVIAATSPLNKWGSNVALSRRILANHSQGKATTTGYLSTGLGKAARILAGEAPESVLTSDKIHNFYLGILSRGTHATAVCVDRHAWDVATGKRHTDAERPGVSGKRYQAAAAAYARAAQIASKELGTELSPAVVQAITWVTWRDRVYSASAVASFDGVAA